MNRPRVVGILSAVLGSTAGFLVLSRWRLAGTITGAIIVPVVYTLVSHSSTESLERVWKWTLRHLRRSTEPTVADAAAPENEKAQDKSPQDASPKSDGPRPAARNLQWAVISLALLAFAVSVYSLTHTGPAGTTILRERVVETVTVTNDGPAFSSARLTDSNLYPTTDASDGLGGVATTTTVPDPDDTSATTVSTVGGSGDQSTTTTVP